MGVHTAGRWVGNDDVIGHVDLFANSGRAHQPGCQQETIDLKCSHLRAWDLYLPTITNSVQLEAQKCSSYDSFMLNQCCSNEIVLFGENVNRTARGKFYFQTTAGHPWKKELTLC